MGELLKPVGETVTDPGAPAYPAYPATTFWLYAPPTPEDTQYRQKSFSNPPGFPPYFPDSPDDFSKWSQLDGSGADGWRGPIRYMYFIRFPGYPQAPNGYPLGAGDGGNFTGVFDVPTLDGMRRETRIYRKDGPHGCLTPYAHPFTDPPYCSTGGPCGVTMLAYFPGRAGVAGRPPVTTTDFRLGWNAGANSVLELDGNVFTTFIPKPQFALVVGLSTRPGSSVTDYTAIEYGLYFANDGGGNLTYARIENGVILSGFAPYSFGDTFEIRRKDGAVSYLRESVPLYESASLSIGPIRVATSEYGGGDIVDNAAFDNLDDDPPPPSFGGEFQAALRIGAVFYQDRIPPGDGRLSIVLPTFHWLSFPPDGEPPELTFGAFDSPLGISAFFSDPGPMGLFADLPPIGAGFFEDADRFGFGLRLGAVFTEDAPLPEPGDYDVELANAGFSLAAALDSAVTAVVMERARLTAAQSNGALSYRSITETVEFDAALTLVFRILVAEGVEFGADLAGDYAAIARVVDGLMLAGVASSVADARATIVAAVAFEAMADMFAKEILAEGIQFDAAVATALTAAAQLVDGILAADVVEGFAVLAALVSERVGLDAAPASAAEAVSTITEGVTFLLHLGLDDGHYLASVINTETKANTTYTNYRFNSFGRLGDTYYGMTPEGPRRLEGPDDDGDPINGRFRMAFSQLGTSRLKRMRCAYLGYTSTGEMWVKVIVQSEVDGKIEAHCYRLHAQPGEVARIARVPIGQGLRTAYWGFELEAIDGAAFAIDVLEWLPILLEQRMHGEGGGDR